MLLDRKWARENIPHFKPVIDACGENEGIEISLTCNADAFHFLIDFLKETTEQERIELVLSRVTTSNCLNMLVTAEFLKLE